MKRRRFLKLTGLGLPCVVLGGRLAPGQTVREMSPMTHPHDTWPIRPGAAITNVTGTPYEMGFQQGQQCAEALRRLIPQWVDGYVKDRLEDAKKVTEHQFASNLNIYPHLLEELRGVADGSGLNYEKIVQMNFRVWNHIGFADAPASGCTAIGMITPRSVPQSSSRMMTSWETSTRRRVR